MKNSQALRIMAELEHPEICPVRKSFLLVLRKQRLKHSLELQLAVFKNKSGDGKYFHFMVSTIAEVIR